MKKILFVWMAFLMSVSAMAQKAELFAYIGEVILGETNKQEVMKHVLQWQFTHLPKDAIIKYNEKAGEVTGTSFLQYESKVNAASELTKGYILYDFKIVATDKGFQYMLTNFRHEAKIRFHTLTNSHSFPYKINVVEKPWYDLVWKDMKHQLDTQIPQMITKMKDATEKGTYSARLEEKKREERIFQIVKSNTQ